MPPRGVVFVILVFWAVMTGVLFHQEILPRIGPVKPPPFSIELTDEIGSPQVRWNVYHKDQQIGWCITSIRRMDDDKGRPKHWHGTFHMEQKFRFEKFEVPALIAVVSIKKLNTDYFVTGAGKLLGFHVFGVADIRALGAGGIEVEGDLVGSIEDGKIQPVLTAKVAGQAVAAPKFEAVAVDDNGSILNPMLLLHRLPRLREGQRWRVPLVDPIKMFAVQGPMGKLPLPENRDPFLDAQVVADTYSWHGADVQCLRVDYRPPGKDIVARTWVRRLDGLVLAQEAKQGEFEFSIQREAEQN